MGDKVVAFTQEDHDTVVSLLNKVYLSQDRDRVTRDILVALEDGMLGMLTFTTMDASLEAARDRLDLGTR